MTLLSVGLSLLWPYFSFSFLIYLQNYALYTNEAAQYLCSVFVIVFLVGVAMVTAFHAVADDVLAKPSTQRLLAVLGAVGTVLQRFPLEYGAVPFFPLFGSVLCAIFFVGTFISYGLALTKLQLRDAFICCLLGFALCLLYAVTYLIPQVVQTVLACISPIVVGGCIVWTTTQLEQASSETAASSEMAGFEVIPWQFVVFLAFFYIAGSLIRGITNPWYLTITASNSTFYTSTVSIVVLVIAAFAFARAHSLNRVLYWLWTISMVCFFGGLLAVSFLPLDLISFSSDVMTISLACFTVLLFLTALRAVDRRHVSPTIAVCLCFMLPEAISMILRFCILPTLTLFAGIEFSRAVAPISAVVMFLLMLVMSVSLNRLLLRQDEAADAADKTVKSSSEISEADKPHQSYMIEGLAYHFNLTPRESEVVSWLARGYNLEKTAEKLHVSINTIRTHSQSAYRKMGIHSRQELIDLVDQANPQTHIP